MLVRWDNLRQPCLHHSLDHRTRPTPCAHLLFLFHVSAGGEMRERWRRLARLGGQRVRVETGVHAIQHLIGRLK